LRTLRNASPRDFEGFILEELMSRGGVRFTEILLITDLTFASDPSISLGISLAKEHGAELHVLHAVPMTNFDLSPTQFEVPWGQTLRSLSAVADSRQAVMGLDEIGSKLRAMSRSHAFDLIIVRAKGPGRRYSDRRILKEVFDSFRCPVLLVGPEVASVNIEPMTIVHATDFSSHALDAGIQAFSWAQRYQSWITMLHVVEGVGAWTETERTRIEEPFLRWLAEIMPEGVPIWCEAEHRVRFGEAAVEIIRTTEELHADLVIIGFNGMDSLSARGPGATTIEVMSLASCPVLVVRAAGSYEQVQRISELSFAA
jgi:nucleotide-binding universal stress UspA family protein